jgi:cytoskeletal protein CcmA (bactofilin family)
MASTYVNNLRLNEMATGDASGTWGTNTNTNLELIADAFGYGTEAITTNADTHSTVIADGSTDPGRALYLKYTGTLDSTCTITITPNTCSKVWIVENATSGSQSIVFQQGSGASVTIANGAVTVCYSDGGGSGANMYNALTDVALAGTATAVTLTASGVITGSTVEATGDTAAGDNAAMGYTSAEGLILTGQGSTNDVTIKNDADADVLEIPTGTTNVTVAGNITSGGSVVIADAGYIGSASDTDAIQIEADGDVVMSQDLAISGTLGVTGETTLATHLNMGDGDIIKLGASADLKIYHDGSNSYVEDAGTGSLVLKGSQVNINSSGDESMAVFVTDGAATLYYDNSAKLATASGGISVTGEVAATSLDISGDVDVDGTLETDAFSIAGTTVTSTAAELNLVDGITAGTIAASKAVIVDSNKDITGFRNVTSTGTITAATDVTVSSDVRLKSNIETIDSALNKVKAMRGVYFDKNDKRSTGVIAQEIQEVMPEVVVTDDTENKHLSVAYGNLVGVLIEAVKELSEEVSELRNNVQTVKFEDS